MHFSKAQWYGIKSHIQKYFPSLKLYGEKYLPLFYQNPNSAPEHFAYLCPLCIKNGMIFDRVNFFGSHSEFSLDHFPPESVGGFLKILICKKCNNDAGGMYEDSLKDLIATMAFNNNVKSAKRKAKAKISDIPGNYDISLTMNGNKKIEISLKPNEKSKTKLLDQWIGASKTNFDWKIDLTIPHVNNTKVSKALLKAAYLYCFHGWGYEFVFSYTGEMIRKVLSNEINYPLNNPSFWLGEAGKNQRLPVGLCQLQSPSEWKSFMINMVLTDKETGFKELASVLIPGPDKEDWLYLGEIQKLLNGKPIMDISMAHIVENYLGTNVYDGYSRCWKSLKQL